MDTYKMHIERAFQNAENSISKITMNIINEEGTIGRKVRYFYNNLLNIEDARYLEIGTCWKGISARSAMFGNKAKVVCISNLSEHGGNTKSDFLVNFEEYKGDNDATFIDDDCCKVDVSMLPKFNIYMYDGKYTDESDYEALLHYYNCLDDTFIFIVNGWIFRVIRDATMNSIQKLNLKVLYEKEIRIPEDESEHLMLETKDTWWTGKETWWNGIYIAILQK